MSGVPREGRSDNQLFANKQQRDEAPAPDLIDLT